MTDDLISRSALKQRIIKDYRKEFFGSVLWNILDDMPTINTVPVVHGRWVYGVTLNHEWRKCSECLVSQEIFGCFTYCPNCGAKMDGGSDNG